MKPSKRRAFIALWSVSLCLVAGGLLVAACQPSTGGCSCSVTINGDHQQVACGQSACVGGRQTACSAQGSIQDGGPCQTGSSKFTCRNAQCDSTTQYCIISTVGSQSLAELCAPFPAGCSNCDCASNNAEAAWKAASNTNNCTGATLLCSQSSAVVNVTCQK